MNRNRTLSLILLMILGIVFCLNPSKAATDTQTYIATDDTHVYMDYPSRNYGNQPEIWMYGTTPDSYGLIAFRSALIADKTIISATIELYVTYLVGTPTLIAFPPTADWNASTVTWDSKPGTIDNLNASVQLTSTGTVSINITHIAVLWANASLIINGLLLKVSSDEANVSSSEGATMYKPKLHLTIEVAGGSPIPSMELFGTMGIIGALIIMYYTRQKAKDSISIPIHT